MAEAAPEAGAASRRLVNATAVMASGTAISRVLGFVKATLLVIVLGANNPLADSYAVATLVPNSLYMIFAGGALNTVLVPQIVRHVRSDADGGEAFVQRIMTAFGVVLAVLAVLATALAGPLMSLWTDASWRAPAMAGHWHQLVLLALLTMPQLFFFGAFFLVGQVLNARDRFGPMMWAPILNNVVGIGVLGLYVALWGTNQAGSVPFTDEQVYLLGLGSTLGIIVQTLALLPALRSIGLRYRLRWDLAGQGLGETFRLASWMLGYVLLTTVVQAVVSRLASSATGSPDGQGAGLAAYSTAYLVWILPHSLLTVSLATAMLPSASRLAASGDLQGVAAETTRTMRLACAFLVPASVGFLALGLPFARIAFGHGAGATGWDAIGWTLVAFAPALVPFTVQYVYLRAYYALEDTRTPFLLQIAIAVVNLGVGLLLVGLGGSPATVAPRLALAYGVAYAVGALVTHAALRRRLPGLSGGTLVQHLARLLLAAARGGIAALVIGWWVLRDGSLPVVVAGFLGAVAVVLVAFFVTARHLRIAEPGELLAVLRRRRGGAEHADGPAPAGGGREADPVTGGPSPVGDPGAGSLAGPGAGGRAEAPEVPTGEAPLLSYPDPHDPHRTPATSFPASDVPVGHVVPGQILNARYRLDEPLHRRGGTSTWRGFDVKLSRPVLVHVMAPGDPRALEILDQARRAAPAVDSRFLRVWDAVLVEEEAHGSYIVCEYAPGQSLELALRQGHFSDLEAAWVVREVASGLVAMHAQGLYHRQLNPDTIIITASGNVKIVGFLVENALHPETSDDADGERADVLALGHLLYAATVGRWPGGARYGLAAAPTDAGGRLLLPRQVTARVSPELSDVVDRIVSRTPRGRASRLTSAQDIDHALTHLLRGQDQSHVLDRRLRFPVSTVQLTVPKPPPTNLLATPLALGDPLARLDAPAPLDTPAPLDVPAVPLPPEVPGTPGATPLGVRGPGERPALPPPRVVPNAGGEDDDEDGTQRWAPGAGDGDSTQSYWFDAEDGDARRPTRDRRPAAEHDDEPENTDRITPVPPPRGGRTGGGTATSASSARSASSERSASSARAFEAARPGGPDARSLPPDPPRRWYGALLGLFAVTLVVSLVMVGNGLSQTARTPQEPATYAVASARDFDPAGDGGDDTENPDQASLAVDGDPTTAWTTERYGRTATFNDRKPGAGVIVDLGEVREVGRVSVLLGSGPTSGEIRVPNDPTAVVPPLGSERDWRTVARFDGAGGEVQLPLDAAEATRFVLVYLTELPRVEPNHQGSIFEVSVGP
ncbi:murein biosynthesis integral membrane protein MurJ [Propioniciclava soli]|uniref:Murein biosynthesis integral membrane protein MurJ n=1 Tax=Propioniciclava soli TaxID=2775081 RepID=A0ABZ3C6L3_9ACTN